MWYQKLTRVPLTASKKQQRLGEDNIGEGPTQSPNKKL